MDRSHSSFPSAIEAFHAVVNPNSVGRGWANAGIDEPWHYFVAAIHIRDRLHGIGGASKRAHHSCWTGPTSQLCQPDSLGLRKD
jgi:hypothetical protein